MPMGIVSDEELLAELKNSGTAQTVPGSGHARVIEKESPGRKEGDVNVPDSLRKIIGETSVIEGRAAALDLAESFGISPSSVSAYANGATSTKTYDEKKPDIIQHINKSRQRAIKRASNTLNRALGAITQEKLDYTDADKLAGIAKDMSAIIKNLEPQKEVEGEGKSTPQFVVFAPQFRDERTFEHITVQE